MIDKAEPLARIGLKSLLTGFFSRLISKKHRPLLLSFCTAGAQSFYASENAFRTQGFYYGFRCGACSSSRDGTAMPEISPSRYPDKRDTSTGRVRKSKDLAFTSFATCAHLVRPSQSSRSASCYGFILRRASSTIAASMLARLSLMGSTASRAACDSRACCSMIMAASCHLRTKESKLPLAFARVPATRGCKGEPGIRFQRSPTLSFKRLGQMWVQHSREEAEVTRLEQRHIKSEEPGCKRETNHEPACIAERFCWEPSIPPQTPDNDQQI